MGVNRDRQAQAFRPESSLSRAWPAPARASLPSTGGGASRGGYTRGPPLVGTPHVQAAAGHRPERRPMAPKATVSVHAKIGSPEAPVAQASIDQIRLPRPRCRPTPEKDLPAEPTRMDLRSFRRRSAGRHRSGPGAPPHRCRYRSLPAPADGHPTVRSSVPGCSRASRRHRASPVGARRPTTWPQGHAVRWRPPATTSR